MANNMSIIILIILKIQTVRVLDKLLFSRFIENSDKILCIDRRLKESYLVGTHTNLLLIRFPNLQDIYKSKSYSILS